MKREVAFVIGALFLSTSLFAQTFNLTVNNGYGSGVYQLGDTVHIWSIAYDSTETFGEWTGDTSFLQTTKEWHTTLIMPNQNISVTAVIESMPSYSIIYEQMMGLNNLKNVYYYFPSNPVGVIYLFHGTGGSAKSFIYGIETRSFINAAIAKGYAIISTEGEEITLDQDIDGDGGKRFMTMPIDTINNVDYRNIKKISSEFINRGWMTANTPKFSVGMSAGANFSAAISYIWDFIGVGYCSDAQNTGFNLRLSPWAYRLAKYDDNPSYNNPIGLYKAMQNDSILGARGICHKLQVHDRQPIYPERFARVPGVSIANSLLIYNELRTNNQIDANGYALSTSVIETNVFANPTAYPTIINFVNLGITGMASQIRASNAEHSFYSDFNYETLTFFSNPCGTTIGVENTELAIDIEIYPNPTRGRFTIKSERMSGVEFFDLTGKLVYKITVDDELIDINLSAFDRGVYFVRVTAFYGVGIKKLILK